MTLPLEVPDRTPRRCRDCGRPVPAGPLIDGRGEVCARRAGHTAPRLPKPGPCDHHGPDLLDQLADQSVNNSDATTTPGACHDHIGFSEKRGGHGGVGPAAPR